MIPTYQPSTTIGEAHGWTGVETHEWTGLLSTDPVSKVIEFYANAIDTGGWETVSKVITHHSGTFVVKKSGEGATISISWLPSRTLISITTYPLPHAHDAPRAQ